MTRILHCSDLHVGLHRYGIDYGDLALERLLAAVEEHQPDLVTLGGDTFNVRRPAPAHIAAVIAAVAEVLRMGASVAIAEGNHDGSTTIIDDRSSSLAWMNLLPWDVHAYPRGTEHSLVRTRVGDVAIASLPFPHHTGDDPAPRVADLAGTLIREYPGALPLYLGHVSVLGALNGSEQSLYLGNDWKVSPNAFDDYDLALLGHIHHRQHHGRAWYPGSPERIDFSEGLQRKGFLLLDEVDGEWKAEVVDSDPPPMVSIRLPDDDLLTQDFEGAITRLTLPGGTFTAAEQAEFVRTIRRGGARYVKVVVEPVARRRASAALVEAVGPTEQLRRWLIANDLSLEPAMTLAGEVMEGAA